MTREPRDEPAHRHVRGYGPSSTSFSGILLACFGIEVSQPDGGQTPLPGGAHLFPKKTERPRQEPRNVHLRDIQFDGDLRLGEAPKEPEVQDAPFPRWKRLQHGSHRGPSVQEFQRLVLLSQSLDRRGALLISWSVQRGR